MNKKKIFIQAILCFGIFAMIQASTWISSDKVSEFRKMTAEKLSENYTLEDVKEIGIHVVKTAMEMPETVNEAVLTVNQIGQYGMPIDENSEQDIKTVHSVAGGQVIRSGLSSDLGMYVSIRHEEGISTYGHLCNITVVAGDRVKKGDIIGSYDSSGAEAFYYDIEKTDG